MKVVQVRQTTEDSTNAVEVVGEGFVLDNGVVVIAWQTKRHVKQLADQTMSMFLSIDDCKAQLGKLLQVADLDFEHISNLYTNFVQDSIESIELDFASGNHKYVWKEREKFALIFSTKEL